MIFGYNHQNGGKIKQGAIMRNEHDYAVYKGDEFLDIGTAKELASKMNVKVETIKFWSTPTYHKRIKNHDIATIVVKLSVEDYD